jgi:beta-glucosidase
VVPSAVVTALAGIVGAAPTVTVTHVAGPPLDSADAAVVAAADAVIVVVGLTKDDEGEGFVTHGDRDSLVLPRNQDDLVAATAALNPRTIVVLEGSGPVLMPWLDDVGAVLMSWYLGQEGGAAIAEALFGDVVPSGKLPLSFPQAEADLPPFDPVSSSVTYDYWHGYRHLDRTGVAPLFPFGFGLSYTTFEFANLTVGPAAVPAGGHVRITADVTNAGSVAATEVAQLYVGYEGSVVERAPRDLKAFARIALAPGETRTVVFDLPTADLAYYDVAAKAWVVEPITYTVYVGNSARDTPLSATFAVTE